MFYLLQLLLSVDEVQVQLCELGPAFLLGPGQLLREINTLDRTKNHLQLAVALVLQRLHIDRVSYTT